MSPPGSRRTSPPLLEAPSEHTQNNPRTEFSEELETSLNIEMLRLTGRSVAEYSKISDPETNALIPPTATSPGFAQESVLTRGLQVPAKSKYVSSGFKYPEILARAGVTKKEWSDFTSEIKKHAKLSASQWMTTIGGSMGVLSIGAVMVGFFGLIPGIIVGHKMRAKKEKQNFIVADREGLLAECVQRWNQEYFFLRRLMIRVDIPGESTDMSAMDISTSKFFEKNLGQSSSRTSDVVSDPKYSDEQVKEGRARLAAARRGRIVIIPLNADGSCIASPPDLEKPVSLPSLVMEDEGEESDYISEGMREIDDGQISMYGIVQEDDRNQYSEKRVS